MADTGILIDSADVEIWAGYSSLADNLRTYLRSTGWVERPTSRMASLWYSSSNEGNSLIIPSHVAPGSFEWKSVVKRLAAYQHEAVGDVVVSIATQYVDVTRLRAEGSDVVQGSIPLKAGVKLVNTARSMLRSVGTTARRPRATIDGKYSLLGDKVVSQARMAHTEDGSYVVPILMPVPEPSSTDAVEPLEGMEIEVMPFESSERRIMRMLAQSIDAANEIIVRSSRAPQRATDLLPFITVGGSKELLTALHAVLSEPSVALLETKFSWAGGVQAPGGVTNTVALNADAAPRLERAAQLLHPSQQFPSQVYTGQIVAVMRRPGADYGEIDLDTIHNNRRCQLRVHLQREAFSKTYDWARDERAVYVEGDVARVARRLTIERPRQIGPLDEMFSHSEE